MGRPLVSDVAGLGSADIALKEIVEGKIGFEMPEEINLTEAVPIKKRKKH